MVGKITLKLAFVYLAGAPLKANHLEFYIHLGYFMLQGSVERHSANIDL